MLPQFRNLVIQYEEAKVHADPRTRYWLLLSNSPIPVWVLTALYLLMVKVGPVIMRDRKPFNLRWFMFVYNMGCVLLSVYMFVEIILCAVDAKYNFFCAVYNKSSLTDPKEMRMARVLWWYFFSKAIELNDTLLMILRKKFTQISFLHVFHHATMLNIWWWVMMFIPGGLSYFGSCLNCLVHIVMYSYYGLSVIPSLRGKLWWKRYITRFQLIQFVCTFSHTAYSLTLDCDFPHWGQYLLTGYMVFMIVLFGNFYFHAYLTKSRQLARTHHKKIDSFSSRSIAVGSDGDFDNVDYNNGYLRTRSRATATSIQ